MTDDEAESMARIGEVISAAERRAMEAERETVDRYVASYLSERVGTVLETRITGVANFGFFATVEGIGGDGLVPVSTLGDDYYRYDEAARTLVGDESGTRYASGMTLPLRLAEADPVSGSLRFELPEGGSAPRRPMRDGRRPVTGKRGRPAGIRHKGGKRK